MSPQIPLPHLHSGKVRDVYDAGDDRLLMVTSDRISAFDVVMAELIANKGRVLTAMTAFWFEQFADLVEGHLISTDTTDLGDVLIGTAGSDDDVLADLAGRTMLCHRAEMLPIECIVRGYITGSAWKEYRSSGTMHGTPMPDDLLEASHLPEPVFTPSTKADEGHDVNISYSEAVDLVGTEVAETARNASIACYLRAPSGLPSGGSSSPIPSSSSAWSTAAWCWPTRFSPRILLGSGPPRRGCQELHHRRSTSNPSVTTSTAWTGISSPHPRHCPTRWCRLPHLGT